MTKTGATAEGPLAGVRILDASRFLSASIGTMMLGEQGADVIKIEAPGIGDPLRYAGARVGDVSGLFANANRGKRSVCIDIAKPAGAAIVRQLARAADVFVHNFRPGVCERLGLGWEAMRAENPRLIYVSVTGFGEDGPLKDAPAYDHILQALLGYTGAQGGRGPRTFMRTAVCDKVMGLTVWQAVTAALLGRTRTGEGMRVDLSMLEACLAFLWPDVHMNNTLLDERVTPGGAISDTYVTFETADGSIAMVAGTDAQWETIFTFLGRGDLLKDPRYARFEARSGHLGALFATLTGAFKSITTADALAHLSAGDVPCAPCLGAQEALAHPQLAGALRIVDDPLLGRMQAPGPPVRFGGKRAEPNMHPPRLGEHSEEVLTEFGVDAEEFTALEQQGVLHRMRA